MRRRCVDEPGVAPPQALTLMSPRNRVASPSTADRHRLLSSCAIVASRVAASSRQAAPLRCASKASQLHPLRASPSSVTSGRPPIRLPPPRGLHRRIAASRTQSRSPRPHTAPSLLCLPARVTSSWRAPYDEPLPQRTPPTGSPFHRSPLASFPLVN
jgi:hypothetical protein